MQQMTDTKRINVNFSGEAYDTLTKLAKAKGKTMSEVLRDAIALEDWLSQVQHEGQRILIQDGDTVREVVFRG